MSLEELRLPPPRCAANRRETGTLRVAATNKVAQDRIGERGCQWLAVREQYRFQRNGLEARQAITLVRPVDVSNALPCHIGKDLIKIDPRRGLVSSARPEPMQMLIAIAIASCFVTMISEPR